MFIVWRIFLPTCFNSDICSTSLVLPKQLLNGYLWKHLPYISVGLLFRIHIHALAYMELVMSNISYKYNVQKKGPDIHTKLRGLLFVHTIFICMFSTHSQFNINIYLYRSLNNKYLFIRRKHWSQSDLHDWNSATPSVLSWKEIWTSCCFAASDGPLKNHLHWRHLLCCHRELRFLKVGTWLVPKTHHPTCYTTVVLSELKKIVFFFLSAKSTFYHHSDTKL